MAREAIVFAIQDERGLYTIFRHVSMPHVRLPRRRRGSR